MFSTQMYDLSHAEAIIARPDGSKRTSEAVIIALRFMEKNHLNLSTACFCECLAYGAEACCLVSAFKLRWAVSIELNEESRALGWSRLSRTSQWAIDHTEMCVSRVQDRYYFLQCCASMLIHNQIDQRLQKLLTF